MFLIKNYKDIKVKQLIKLSSMVLISQYWCGKRSEEKY